MTPSLGLSALPNGWEPRVGLNGRVYYYSFHSQTLQILPPPEIWNCVFNLPYGWELASDYEENSYFINHMLQTVTYDDPREQYTNDDNTTTPATNHLPRICTITRDVNLGFGFIAGSEKPVIVRSVSPGGPSDNKLLPGDFIIKIGDENVKNANRERVIELIRSCEGSVTLTVIQPSRTASSSFLKPEKKLIKGMNRPRVRFADDSSVNGDNKISGSSRLLVVPGVLRVLLEEGQTRSFQFNQETTAGDVVTTLCEKLNIVDSQLYALVLAAPDDDKDTTQNCENEEISHFNEILVAPWDSIAKVVNNPSLKYHDCHFRLAFVSKDVHKLSRDDPKSFQYLYVQCVNDVVSGKVYKNDLNTDDLLKLASLQIIEMNVAQNTNKVIATQNKNSGKKLSFQSANKIIVKQIEKEYGLSRFLPPDVLADVNSNHSKESRKTLQNYIKTNYNSYVMVGGPGLDQKGFSTPASPNNTPMSKESVLTKLRMQYLKTLSHLHPYGGSYFEATILDVMEADITLIVGHHYGISQLIKSKTKMASLFGDFSVVGSVEVAPCAPEARKTNVRVDFKDMAPLVLAMHPLSALNFAFMISGYCRVYDNNDMMLTLPLTNSEIAPDYYGQHRVRKSNWNYPPDDSKEPTDVTNFQYCDFSEPISISLLSDQIPASVRAMFQQNRDPGVSEDEPSTSQHEQSVAMDDEGVAMVTNDLSPPSSVSSVASLSPSSGIGSVTSHNHVTAENKSEDEAEWNQLMVALSVDEEMTSLGSNKNGGDEANGVQNGEIQENGRIEEDAEENAGLGESGAVAFSSSDESENGDVALAVSAVKLENGIGEENVENENGGIMEVEEESSKQITESSANVIEPETEEISENKISSESENHGDQFSAERNDDEVTTSSLKDVEEMTERKISQSSSSSKRLSSFLPLGGGENVGDGVPAVDELHSPMTREELAANLNEASGKDVVILHCQDEDEVVSSPFPVADLAQGQKKSAKRRFWFRSNRLSRSISLDKGLASRNETNSKKSFFRRIFSPKRSYSMKRDEGGASTFSLSDDVMPPDGSSGRSTVKSADRTTSRFKFSFFKGWGRKRRSRTMVVNNGDVSPPVVSGTMSSGVYSVFDPPVGRGAEADVVEFPRSSSMEDVHLRPHDNSSPAPRPVSFMTFQRSTTLPSREVTSPTENRPPSVTSSRRSSKSDDAVDDPPARIENKPPSKPRRLTIENKLKQSLSDESLSVEPVSPPKAAKRKAPPPPPASKIPADDDSDQECDKVTEFNSVVSNRSSESSFVAANDATDKELATDAVESRDTGDGDVVKWISTDDVIDTASIEEVVEHQKNMDEQMQAGSTVFDDVESRDTDDGDVIRVNPTDGVTDNASIEEVVEQQENIEEQMQVGSTVFDDVESRDTDEDRDDVAESVAAHCIIGDSSTMAIVEDSENIEQVEASADYESRGTEDDVIEAVTNNDVIENGPFKEIIEDQTNESEQIMSENDFPAESDANDDVNKIILTDDVIADTSIKDTVKDQETIEQLQSNGDSLANAESRDCDVIANSVSAQETRQGSEFVEPVETEFDLENCSGESQDPVVLGRCDFGQNDCAEVVEIASEGATDVSTPTATQIPRSTMHRHSCDVMLSHSGVSDTEATLIGRISDNDTNDFGNFDVTSEVVTPSLEKEDISNVETFTTLNHGSDVSKSDTNARVFDSENLESIPILKPPAQFDSASSSSDSSDYVNRMTSHDVDDATVTQESEGVFLEHFPLNDRPRTSENYPGSVNRGGGLSETIPDVSTDVPDVPPQSRTSELRDAWVRDPVKSEYPESAHVKKDQFISITDQNTTDRHISQHGDKENFSANEQKLITTDPEKMPLHLNASRSGYSSLVTPRLFGQKNEYKPYSRIKAPIFKGKAQLKTDIKSTAILQNGEFTAPKKVIRSVRPPVAPKPSFLQ